MSADEKTKTCSGCQDDLRLYKFTSYDDDDVETTHDTCELCRMSVAELAKQLRWTQKCVSQEIESGSEWKTVAIDLRKTMDDAAAARDELLRQLKEANEDRKSERDTLREVIHQRNQAWSEIEEIKKTIEARCRAEMRGLREELKEKTREARILRKRERKRVKKSDSPPSYIDSISEVEPPAYEMKED